MILPKLDRHVNEMMKTAGKTFKNFLWSRFLIIVQNVNMVTNGKHDSKLNPMLWFADQTVSPSSENIANLQGPPRKNPLIQSMTSFSRES